MATKLMEEFKLTIIFQLNEMITFGTLNKNEKNNISRQEFSFIY